MTTAAVFDRRVPLDYCYALDGARLALADGGTPLILCRIAQLDDEIRRRFSATTGNDIPGGALWVEPQRSDWFADLAALSRTLTSNATLAVIASQPLARMLPERRAWAGAPIGMRPGGISALRRALRRAGFQLSVQYGLHVPLAIGTSLLGQIAQRLGRPDIGDRLHFAARARYCVTGAQAAFGTVALLVAKKEPAPW
jgi:hypothetical protein